MIKAVIFDMDGVIVDSEPIHYRLNKELFEKLQLNITEEEYRNFVGVTDWDMWSVIKERHRRPETVEELLAIHREHSRSEMQKLELEPIPGVLKLLNRLKAANLKMAIASSAPVDWIQVVVSKCQIESYFDVLVSGEHVVHGKPAPDIFLLAAEKLQVPPSECLVIEDAERGVRAAKAAGMQCIGYQNPNSYGQDLSLADRIIYHMDELTL